MPDHRRTLRPGGAREARDGVRHLADFAIPDHTRPARDALRAATVRLHVPIGRPPGAPRLSARSADVVETVTAAQHGAVALPAPSNEASAPSAFGTVRGPRRTRYGRHQPRQRRPAGRAAPQATATVATPRRDTGVRRVPESQARHLLGHSTAPRRADDDIRLTIAAQTTLAVPDNQ
ncbi:hypothetical protein [Streptomyces sp. x-80]|uniref:hypothetical protein n=1 Tax=Streptomyces sp. x-80 TaxID=2789282 RepID=UPI00397F9032